MTFKTIFVLLIAMMALAPAARADWDIGDGSKWLQRPDPTEGGIDVDASQHILADDFRCYNTGPVTDIHIWGSWFGDSPPYGTEPDSVKFVFAFHADIPDSESATGYSMPGDMLWIHTFLPGEFTSRVWNDTTREGWLFPPDNYSWPSDTVCWQYNFHVPAGEEFVQGGTPENPVVYWLHMSAYPYESASASFFGWKTSTRWWNDAAVWGQGGEPYNGPWHMLTYPQGHSRVGEDIHLAFVLQGDGIYKDYGDAPDDVMSPGYPTLAAHNGASHVISDSWLGPIGEWGASEMPDAEPDGQPDSGALGDDLSGRSDEDGLILRTAPLGGMAEAEFFYGGGGGFVQLWIDFDGDQAWQHTGERVLHAHLGAGMRLAFEYPVPPDAVTGNTFARIRLSGVDDIPPYGPAPDGEVEDHRLYIQDRITDSGKWLQYPELTDMGMDVNCGYPLLLADDFLCDMTGGITEIDIWGSWKNDYPPYGNDPDSVKFILSVHEDIPDSLSPTGYSMPGNVLWVKTFMPGKFTSFVWQDGLNEGWLTPPDTYLFPGDHICWHYKFPVPPEEAFVQQGTSEDSVVYWLDVQALPYDKQASFGWKTAFDRWNDGAVWTTGEEPYNGLWNLLLYPPEHPLAGREMHMAFQVQTDSISSVTTEKPAQFGFGLYQNIPNPFTGSTTLRYSLPPAGGHVRLDVFDVRGRLIVRLADEARTGGTHTATWDGRDSDRRELPAGIYFMRLSLGELETARKMLLLK